MDRVSLRRRFVLLTLAVMFLTVGLFSVAVSLRPWAADAAPNAVIQRDRGTLENWVASAARTATGNQTIGSNFGSADSLRCQLNVTASSGTSPTLDVVIQDTLDGSNWNTIGTFAQKTAVSREVINVTTPFAETIRVLWTIGGTTPSFTFPVDCYVQ